MAEWRRLLKSWPVVQPKAAAFRKDVAILRHDSTNGVMAGKLALGLLSVLLVWIGVGGLLFACFAPDGKGPVAALIALGCSAGVISSLCLAAYRLAFYTRELLRKKDLKELDDLGVPSFAGEYVGVAYSDGAWTVNGDVSWDRGLLSLDWDRMTYRGLKSRFDLLPHQIEGIEVCRWSFSPTGSVPLIFVHWISAAGTSETLSLEARDAGNRRAVVEAAEELRLKIERWRSGRLPGLPDAQEPIEPLRSSEMPLEPPMFLRVSRNAAALGWLAGFLASLVLEVVMVLFCVLVLHWSPGPICSLPYVIGMGWGRVYFAPWIERRLPSPLRSPAFQTKYPEGAIAPTAATHPSQSSTYR